MTNEMLSEDFWPDHILLVISVSMQFEAGGQPPKGTDSPFPKVDFPESVPSDAAANTWFAYGYREGIPRMLDLWDRHGVKVTSHMIGEAAQRHPELAREIVARGHEAAGHGPRWSSQYAMSREEERQFLIAARDMVEWATGQRPIGYNCNCCGVARTPCLCCKSSVSSITSMTSARTSHLSSRSTARTWLSCPTPCATMTFC